MPRRKGTREASATERERATSKRKGQEERDEANPITAEAPVIGPIPDGIGPETTGRTIIVFKEEAAADAAAIRSTLNREAGLRNVMASADFEGGAITEDLAEGEAMHFNKLGIVVVSGEEAVQALAATASDADSPILTIEPEYVAYPSGPTASGLSIDYLRGYRDAVNRLYDEAVAGGQPRERKPNSRPSSRTPRSLPGTSKSPG